MTASVQAGVKVFLLIFALVGKKDCFRFPMNVCSMHQDSQYAHPECNRSLQHLRYDFARFVVCCGLQMKVSSAVGRWNRPQPVLPIGEQQTYLRRNKCKSDYVRISSRLSLRVNRGGLQSRMTTTSSMRPGSIFRNKCVG